MMTHEKQAALFAMTDEILRSSRKSLAESQDAIHDLLVMTEASRRQCDLTWQILQGSAEAESG